MQYAFSSPLSETTENIRVSVRSAYITEESSTEQSYFVYAYKVEIQNESSTPVQLLFRKWEIVDGFGDRRSVHGEGVIGRKPVILPKQSHSYMSGCHFKTPIGKMYGTYTMIRLDDQIEFEVTIPPFVLTLPALNN
ncbi:MAG: Co2+/Mg2+ efflux protein ApaG [Bacteroidota bacterium]